ncbi:zinc finger protein 418-like [Biomphalaria glabrata]|uniref:Zinc finger protein 418-like n=1 Tax=Biomphalaria glabrata TaxID=6526 RepID=A0A9W2YYE5_BIOGL|nr:zinc finger protein 418-like [Biomphalaria glabrata]
MKPWTHYGLLTPPYCIRGGTRPENVNQDHLFLSMPVSAHGVHHDPLLHSYWPRPLSVYEEANGLAGTVFKPVAIRLTNIYAGLPLSLSLVGQCRALEPNYGARPVGLEDIEGQPNRAHQFPFIPQEISGPNTNYLREFMSLQPSHFSYPSHTSSSEMNQKLKDLLHFRQELLQDRALCLDSHGIPICYGNLQPRASSEAASQSSNEASKKGQTERSLASTPEPNAEEISSLLRQNTTGRGVDDVKLKHNNKTFAKAQSNTLLFKKSRRKFVSSLSKFKKQNVNKVKNSNENVCADANVNENKMADTSDNLVSSSSSRVDAIDTKKMKMSGLASLLITEGQRSLTTLANDLSNQSADENVESRSGSAHMYQSLVSPGDDRKSFSCPQCRYTTDRKNNLKRHVVTMHQESSKTLECCGVVFQSKALLRDHNSVFHRGGYRCQVCSRNFCRKALLRRHLTVHSGQKDFFCALCGYATSHKSNLERHQKVHTKKDPSDTRLKRECSFKKSITNEIRRPSTDTNGTLKFISKKKLEFAEKGLTNSTNISNSLTSNRERPFVEKADVNKTKCKDSHTGEQCMVSGNTSLRSYFSSDSFRPKNFPSETGQNLATKQDSVLVWSMLDSASSDHPSNVKARDANGMGGSNEVANMVIRTNATSSDIRKRLFPVRYECSDCGRRFKIQSDLSLHERQCMPRD